MHAYNLLLFGKNQFQTRRFSTQNMIQQMFMNKQSQNNYWSLLLVGKQVSSTHNVPKEIKKEISPTDEYVFWKTRNILWDQKSWNDRILKT